MKSIYKVDSSEFYSICNVPKAERSSGIIKRYYVDNNETIITKPIITTNDNDIMEFSFERQNISDVIIHNIEIQFALYQFFVMYSDVENKNERSNEKINCQICYPKDENNLSSFQLSMLLSIFDSLIVDYQKNKAIVLGQLSNLDSKIKLHDTYKRLYKESLLNPFIISFLNKKNGHKMEDVSDCIYQYQPQEDDKEVVCLNKEEMIFIEFIKQQLILSEGCFVFYCLGWNAYNLETSITMKKLNKYFKRMFFLSTSNKFSSLYLIIDNNI